MTWIARVVHLDGAGAPSDAVSKPGCIVSIAGQRSVLTRDFFSVTFPLKYIVLNPFDVNVANLVAMMEREMSCKVFGDTAIAGNDRRVLEGL